MPARVPASVAVAGLSGVLDMLASMMLLALAKSITFLSADSWSVTSIWA